MSWFFKHPDHAPSQQHRTLASAAECHVSRDQLVSFSEYICFGNFSPFVHLNTKGSTGFLCQFPHKAEKAPEAVFYLFILFFKETPLSAIGIRDIRIWETGSRPCLRFWESHGGERYRRAPPACPLTSLLLTNFSIALTRSAAVGTSVGACRAASKEDCKTRTAKEKRVSKR